MSQKRQFFLSSSGIFTLDWNPRSCPCLEALEASSKQQGTDDDVNPGGAGQERGRKSSAIRSRREQLSSWSRGEYSVSGEQLGSPSVPKEQRHDRFTMVSETGWGSPLHQLSIRATADQLYSQVSSRTEFCLLVQWACFCFCNQEPKSSRIILSYFSLALGHLRN